MTNRPGGTRPHYTDRGATGIEKYNKFSFLNVQMEKIQNTHITLNASHCIFMMVWKNTYLLLAECEVCTASYGPSFFLPFMAQAQSAWAMNTRKEKMKIHNLPYGLSKQG